MLEFTCPTCKARYRVADDKAGLTVRCRACKSRFIVPQPRAIEKSDVTSSSDGKMTVRKACETLGIPSKTTLREAKKAYRQLVKKWHPDTGCEKSAARFVSIVRAYEYLKDHVEGRKARAAADALQRSRPTPPPMHPPVYDLSYASFISDLDEATEETIQLLYRQKSEFAERLRGLLDLQISSYTSANEFRSRMQQDVDAVIQRELWAFLERLGRRCEVVEESFKAWVARMRASAYEVGLPHTMTDYLSRPGGIVLSTVIFLILNSSAYLAMFMSPTPFFSRGAIPILAGILASAASALISLYGGKAMYLRAAKRKGRRERAALMAAVGVDSFTVGAMPSSQAWSSGERAGAAGLGVGGVGIWLGLEPVTGLIAGAIAAIWGWATGKTLVKMQKEAKENIWSALEPRLDDFFDGFSDKLIASNDRRLQRMRKLYTAAFGPAGEPLLRRTRVRRPRLTGHA